MGLRGLHVDYQLELRRLFHGQVTWLGALEDLVNLGCGTDTRLKKIRRIGYETTGLCILAERTRRGEAALRGESRDLDSRGNEHRVYNHGQCLGPLFRHGLESHVD